VSSNELESQINQKDIENEFVMVESKNRPGSGIRPEVEEDDKNLKKR